MSVIKSGASTRLHSTEFMPPLRAVDHLEGEGLQFRLSHGIRTPEGVPGYVFDISEGSESIGSAMVLLTHDLNAIREVGHMGCEVRPEKRGKGYTVRLARALFPFVQQHGIRELLVTCDIGHKSQYQSIMALGGEFLDELPARSPDDKGKARYRILLPSGGNGTAQ
jgi:predicted acetyltransferase